MEGCPNGGKKISVPQPSRFSILRFWRSRRTSVPSPLPVQSLVTTQSDGATGVVDAPPANGECRDKQMMSNRLESVEHEKELFQAQIVEQGSRMLRLKEDKTELEATVEAQSKKLAEIELELSLRREEAQNNQRKLATYKQEKEKLTDALGDTQQEVTESKEGARELQTEIESLKRDNDSLKRDNDSLTIALNESETQLRQLLEISNIPELTLRKTGKKVASGAFGG